MIYNRILGHISEILWGLNLYLQMCLGSSTSLCQELMVSSVTVFFVCRNKPPSPTPPPLGLTGCSEVVLMWHSWLPPNVALRHGQRPPVLSRLSKRLDSRMFVVQSWSSAGDPGQPHLCERWRPSSRPASSTSGIRTVFDASTCELSFSLYNDRLQIVWKWPHKPLQTDGQQ